MRQNARSNKRKARGKRPKANSASDKKHKPKVVRIEARRKRQGEKGKGLGHKANG